MKHFGECGIEWGGLFYLYESYRLSMIHREAYSQIRLLFQSQQDKHPKDVKRHYTEYLTEI